MKKSLLNVKSEKGSVTVFVLIAILFFTVVLTTLYASNMNILSSQNKNIETLASNYKQSIEGMDAMYQQLADRENATFVTGENFNIALKKAAGESGATTSSTDTKIKTITFDRYTNQLEKVKNKTGVAVDSGNNGDIKIYVIKNESNDYEAYVLSSNGEFNLNKNASSMFKNLTVLEKINNLTSVHTALTENISDMFSGCSALLEADISSFNTAKLTNTANMFNGCTNLKTIYASTTWIIDGITSSTNMFTNCTSLVGGYGTTYNSSITDKTYARIDLESLLGYFTEKNAEEEKIMYPKAKVGEFTTSLSTINGKNYSAINPPIPKGYAPLNYGEAVWESARATYNKGLVISDSTTADTGNEWVWVPVEDVTTYVTASSPITLLGTTATTSKYTKSNTIMDLNPRVLPGDSSGYREPDVLSNYDTDAGYYNTILGFASTQKMAETFVDEYNTMLESIKKYGGFYMGRYELSSVGVKKNQAPLINTDWYNLYNNCKNFAKSGSNTTSRMVYGAQWDMMSLWMFSTCFESDVTKIYPSTSYGNYYDSTVTADDGTTVLKAANTSTKLNTGVTKYTKVNNIYDFAGNVNEWTQEAVGTGSRVLRSGNYGQAGSIWPGYDRDDNKNNGKTISTSNEYGTRPTLILNP